MDKNVTKVERPGNLDLDLDELYDLRSSLISDYLAARKDLELGRQKNIVYVNLVILAEYVYPLVFASGRVCRDLKAGRNPDREAVDELRLAGLI